MLVQVKIAIKDIGVILGKEHKWKIRARKMTIVT